MTKNQLQENWNIKKRINQTPYYYDSKEGKYFKNVRRELQDLIADENRNGNL